MKLTQEHKKRGNINNSVSDLYIKPERKEDVKRHNNRKVKYINTMLHLSKKMYIQSDFSLGLLLG